MASFYADEQVPFTLVDALRLLGHDVLTARDDGRANQGIPDPDVLARAIQLGRAVLTNNRHHFHRLHYRNPAHTGIVTYTDDPDRSSIAERVDAAIAGLPSLAGRLIRVIRPNPPPRPQTP